jgi:hypothetical protein
MGLTIRNACVGCAAGIGAALACLVPLCALAAGLEDAGRCATERAALRAMLETEYAFGQRAKSSVRGAFLEYLADDSRVLHPGPEPGRAVYLSAKDSKNELEWYPTVGDVAPSGDLGFTAGPWTYTLADNDKQFHGHFLTVWKRDARCTWHVEFDGGVSHAAPTSAEQKLIPDQATFTKSELPPPRFVTDDAPGHAVSDFQETAQQDGFAAALRTYGRDNDFIFFTDEQSPAGIAGTITYLNAHAIMGVWKESARGRSADSTILYAVGELTDSNDLSTYAYVQIWQFDPKVANWGLRMLLINPLPPTKAK